MNPDRHPVLRVTRSKAQAKQSYDSMSRYYDWFAGIFEQKYRDMALRRLAVAKGETVLEIGFGTGHCLVHMARAVGQAGRVYGIDISSGMLAVSRRRLKKAGLWDRVELACDDAVAMPYADGQFDAVFSSFALELFDTPEIPVLLAEIRRVLKPKGRVGMVSMSQDDGNWLLRAYEWFHQKLPQYADCRPIYVKQSIRDAGFEVQHSERIRMLGLPAEIVVAVKPVPATETRACADAPPHGEPEEPFWRSA